MPDDFWFTAACSNVGCARMRVRLHAMFMLNHHPRASSDGVQRIAGEASGEGKGKYRCRASRRDQSGRFSPITNVVGTGRREVRRGGLYRVMERKRKQNREAGMTLGAHADGHRALLLHHECFGNFYSACFCPIQRVVRHNRKSSTSSISVALISHHMSSHRQ